MPDSVQDPDLELEISKPEQRPDVDLESWKPEHRWELIYNQVPLCDVPRHFAGMSRSPFMIRYLKTVLELCPRGGRTCETGIGSGYGTIWLSLRGIKAEGIDYAPGIVERARQINNLLGGSASFRVSDLFRFFKQANNRYQVIHHQGVLEHFAVPYIHAALAHQVVSANYVVFSVPSVYYPFDPEFGDERLLPLEEWQRILEPFDVAELTYYGDPQHGEREHVLCVVRGQPADSRAGIDDKLLKLMTVPEKPYPEGISAIVHTRNEEKRIGECLKSLQGWTDEIIVCDMESKDATVEIARRYTDNIVEHPHIPNFDRARNVSAMRARHRWVFYLDADERVPPGLGPALRDLIATRGDTFEAVLLPFRHYFAGRWMQCLYPGYTAPRLLKNGKFVFNARPHSGAQVNGRIVSFPADNPSLALMHYSFESLAHYLDKLNLYTDREARNMHQDGYPYHWQNAVRHFVHDFQAYYDQGHATQDGVHGFIYSFLSAFYRFEQHAKLFEHRFHHQQLQSNEMEIPANVEQVLEFALSVARQKQLPKPPEIRIDPTAAKPARIVWSGPLFDPSGYGEESRHFLFALDEAKVPVAAQPFPWSFDEVDMHPEARQRLQELTQRPVAPGFIQIIQNFPTGYVRHPQARVVIGRTMFETDRLPVEWVKACNQMDYIWVPSEFNRETFTQAGVAREKLVVIPGCLNPHEFPEVIRTMAGEKRGDASHTVPSQTPTLPHPSPFTFLSIFDWTLHKGWDVLLHAFLEAFEGEENVALTLKVWSTMGYTAEQIREQATTYVREKLNHDLSADTRVRFLHEKLSRDGLRELYRSVDAFVLPSRGEGWGRPYMEAMACGLPVIGTNWSGNTAFMNPDNSYLIDCEVQPVPERGWREIPTYRGHRWTEPNREHLKQLMRRVFEERDEASLVGQRARDHVLTNFNRAKIGQLMAQEIERVSGGVETEMIETTSGSASPATPSPCRPFTLSPDGRTNLEIYPTGHSSPATCHRVRWEGAQFVWHSLAYVNRELCLGLLEAGQVELSLIPNEPAWFAAAEEPRFSKLERRFFAPLSGPADIHVRHFFPPHLNPPDEGHFVLMQPWEYGYLPNQWIPLIQKNVAEVWCYSRYVREVYKASGIPEDRLHVVPLGVDTSVFDSSAPPYIFTTEPGASSLKEGIKDRFTFLYVGGTIQRKGIDLLLDAYLKAFSAVDEVCLVIKDTGVQGVYRGQNAREHILSLIDNPTRPPIIYIEDDLTAHQLAGLYVASDCLVAPYRGEGFCLPALEAMSCGRPVIVPMGGPTDDFVDEAVGWRIAAERRPFNDGRIGEWDCCGTTWTFEVSADELARLLRQVYHHLEEVKRRGEAAVQRVRDSWTWKHSASVALQRLKALADFDHYPLNHDHPLNHDREGVVGVGSTVRSQPTISLCMIVRNEERVLGQCLESIKPWVDEIIIIDTGSTDRTVEIAETFGAKLFHFPWCDDFSAARNESLRHATGDWIFWMDADDTIPEECGRKLHEMVFLAEDRVTGFLMQVHVPAAPGEEGCTVVDHVKLFRNLPELRFEGRIHEQILESINRTGGRIERSDLHVVHSGYDYSEEGQRRKRERDLLLLENDLKDRPDHPFVLFNIGMTAFYTKDFERAVPALERCLALSNSKESTVRKVYALLAGCHLEQRNLAKAKEWLEQGIGRFPNDPELLFRAGIIYRELGDLPAAERSYLHLLTAREVGHIDSLDISMTGYKAHHNLALIYQDMGRSAEAEAQWQAAIADNPKFVLSWLGLGELYLRMRRFDDANGIVQKLVEIDTNQAEVLRSRLAQARRGH